MNSCECNKLCNKVCNSSGTFVEISGLCDPTQFDLTTYNNWTQISIPTVFDIPSQKPDIEELNAESISVQIIRKKVIDTPISGTENLEGKILTGKKLAVDGLICKAITYTADFPEQPIHSAHASVPFSAYIVLPTDTLLTDNFDVKTCIEDVFITEICKRQVFQNITLFLQAVPAPAVECNEDCSDLDVVSIKGITDGTDLLAITTGDKWTQMIISENLVVPHQKPDIEQINQLVSQIEIISQRVIKTPGPTGNNWEDTKLTNRKLIIEGVLRQKIAYTAEVEDASQPLHGVHFDVPFSAFIVVDEDTPTNARYKIESYIEDIFICAVNKRTVFKNTIVFIKATKCA